MSRHHTITVPPSPMTGGMFYAYCDDCHSPDGSGDGRTDFYATTLGEVDTWREDHIYAEAFEAGYNKAVIGRWEGEGS